MLIDARSLPDGQVIDSDICIIGGGAAGIAIATALAGRNLKVCVIESGGFDFDPKVQDLAEGPSVGHSLDLYAMRLKFLGGSTNHWGGFTRPIDPYAFEERSWFELPGWPLTYEELEYWVAPAMAFCGVGPEGFEPAYWTEADGAPANLWPLDGTPLASGVWQVCPLPGFGHAYYAALQSQDGLGVFLNATALGLETNAEGSQVTGVKLGCLDGRRLTAKARRYVIAGGGLENARLLLLSNAANPNGLGTGQDWVGRCFMEHPHLVVGTYYPGSPEGDPAFYVDDGFNDQRVVGCVTFREDYLRANDLRSFSVTLHATNAGAELRGYSAMRDLRAAWRRGKLPDHLGDMLWDVLTDSPQLATLYVEERMGRAPAAYHFSGRVEQSPLRDSRVTLADTKDAFGLPRSRLDWKLGQADFEALKRATRVLCATVEERGLGRAVSILEDFETWPEVTTGAGHHMGTTRMSDGPADGVVDRDCKVHGVENLYVAGCSIFPAGGYSNPTLSLVAFALRLADHLASHEI